MIRIEAATFGHVAEQHQAALGWIFSTAMVAANDPGGLEELGPETPPPRIAQRPVVRARAELRPVK
jgi:hypothetical protein